MKSREKNIIFFFVIFSIKIILNSKNSPKSQNSSEIKSSHLK